MKILLCTTNYGHAASGSGRFAQLVGSLGHYYPEIIVEVLSEDIGMWKQPKTHQVRLSALSKWRILGYWYKSRDYAQTLHYLLSDQVFDIIFFNDAWLACHALELCRNVATIVSIRDDNAIYRTDNPIPAIPGLMVRRWMERRVLRCTNLVLTNSEYMCKVIGKKYGVERKKLHIISPGYVDRAGLSSYRSCAITSPVRVLFVKQDIHRGGLALLARALQVLGQYQFRLTVVGPAIHEVERKLRKEKVRTTNVEWNVVGKIYDHAQVLRIMKEQDIFCVPASREAFGSANIEALAAGLRVVCYITGGIPNELRRYGFEIQDRTVHGLASAIEDAIQARPAVVQQKLRGGVLWAKYIVDIERTRSALKEYLCQVNKTSNPESRTA